MSKKVVEFKAVDLIKDNLNTPKKIAQSRALARRTVATGINMTAMTHVARVAISQDLDNDTTMSSEEKIAELNALGQLSKANKEKLGLTE